MADAKKVQIEITGPKIVVPQSIHENRHLGKVAETGEVLEVYEDVAGKLVSYHHATVVTKDQPATLAKDLEKQAEDEKARRQNLLTGEKADEVAKEEKPKKK